MYDELIKALHERAEFLECSTPGIKNSFAKMCHNAADAIEELNAKVDSLQLYVDSISNLPDCNTCLNNNTCEFRPKLGEYCRINCHEWVKRPPKGGTE